MKKDTKWNQQTKNWCWEKEEEKKCFFVCYEIEYEKEKKEKKKNATHPIVDIICSFVHTYKCMFICINVYKCNILA